MICRHLRGVAAKVIARMRNACLFGCWVHWLARVDLRHLKNQGQQLYRTHLIRKALTSFCEHHRRVKLVTSALKNMLHSRLSSAWASWHGLVHVRREGVALSDVMYDNAVSRHCAEVLGIAFFSLALWRHRAIQLRRILHQVRSVSASVFACGNCFLARTCHSVHLQDK